MNCILLESSIKGYIITTLSNFYTYKNMLTSTETETEDNFTKQVQDFLSSSGGKIFSCTSNKQFERFCELLGDPTIQPINPDDITCRQTRGYIFSDNGCFNYNIRDDAKNGEYECNIKTVKDNNDN